MAQAILNGSILDDGGLDCEGRFQYGTTLALGTYTPWVRSGMRTGDTFQALLTNLMGNTIYYFQAEARNALGAGTAGSVLSFITTLPAVPEVAIMAPTLLAEYAATLQGYIINDGGRGGSVRFEYGPSTSYGMVTPWMSGYITGDTFNHRITGLSPGNSYHCRAVFKINPIVYSGDLAFTTPSEVGAMTLIDDELLHMLEER
ncbi:MAG: hypothetical protein PHQ43_08245 [Dehalococcoidales bacterium]|nr:hypothetical protein [Dehalococcoidales bacterium]